MHQPIKPTENYKPHFMITAFVLIIMATVFIFMYRKAIEEKKELLRIARENLEFSNHCITEETAMRVAQFKMYMKKPELAEKVEIWYGFIEKTEPIVSNMESLLTTSLQQQHSTKQERIQLMDNLRLTCRNLVETVPKESRKHLPRLPLQRLLPDSINKNDTLWNEKLLLQTNDTDWKFVLLNLHNELIRSAAIVKLFYTEQTATHAVLDHEMLDMLISQNSLAVLPGQTFELKAGMGAFNIAAKPSVFVNGQLIKINESGYAEYKKVVATNDPGKLQVTIQYTDQNGFEATRSQMIFYKVLKQ